MKKPTSQKYAGFLFLELIGLALMAAYLLKQYEDEFDTGKWENWVRILPYFVTAVAMMSVFASVANWSRCGLKWCVLLYLCNLGLVGFNLVMSTAASSYSTCVEYDNFCLESKSCSGSADDAWRALLYILGLTIVITAHSLAIFDLCRYLMPKTDSSASETDSQNQIMDNPIRSGKRISDITQVDATETSFPARGKSRTLSLVAELSEENLAAFEAQNKTNAEETASFWEGFRMEEQKAQEQPSLVYDSNETDPPPSGYDAPGIIDTRSGNKRGSTRHQSVAPSGTINTTTVKRLYPLE